MTTPPPIPLAQQIEGQQRLIKWLAEQQGIDAHPEEVVMAQAVLASLQSLQQLKADKDVLIAALTKEIGAEGVYVLLRNTRWLDELTAEAERLGLYDTKLGTETGEKG